MQQTCEGRSPTGPRRAVLLLCGIAIATSIASAQSAIDFRTSDGTFFVLVPASGAAIVHWTVATPIGPQVDPASTPGLAAACAQASLRGTWDIGSLDADRERKALAELDEAETIVDIAPSLSGTAAEPARRAELLARVAQLRSVADALCDPLAFRRVLATAPARNVRLRFDQDTAILSLTTTPLGVTAVARLLYNRRESQALRSVRQDLAQLQQEATTEWDRSPMAPLYAETLALAFPSHALARAGDRPSIGGFRRQLALEVFAKSQHPRNTVHVLTGSFDVTALKSALEGIFTTTALQQPEVLQKAAPRAQAAVRRAMVPGAKRPAALIAYSLPAGLDATSVATVAQWFAGGDDSWLGRELVRSGRKTATVAVRAPWPESAATGLLVIEVMDQAGTSVKLADDVLALCTKGRQATPEVGQLPQAFTRVRHEFEAETGGSPSLASWIARRTLQNGGTALPQPPEVPPFAELTALLRRILATNPVVVEWRDA